MGTTGSRLFAQMAATQHEQVVFCHDADAGLRAIIAIHDTRLGPALGGCRMYPYESEQDALLDVLRLSQGMTLKAAVSGLSLGGGKAVIMGDPQADKSPALWRAFGRFVDRLAGRYVTAEDVGTSQADMEAIRGVTRHVVGVPVGLGGSGDPSPVTALGVFVGMQAAAQEAFGSPELRGREVAVQGCGHVGMQLVRQLAAAGAKVLVADVNRAAAEALQAECGATPVAPAELLRTPCDILAPCAMGGVLNADSIPLLRCRVVAGAANNQLADELVDGAALAARGIVYAPDYVINAGGLINVAHELRGYDAARATAQVRAIFGVTQQIFAHARARGVPNVAAARELAQARLQAAGAELSDLPRPATLRPCG